MDLWQGSLSRARAGGASVPKIPGGAVREANNETRKPEKKAQKLPPKSAGKDAGGRKEGLGGMPPAR